ncbi:hypothetical protein [Sphingobium scionense]
MRKAGDMTEAEITFARQSAFLADAHSIADFAILMLGDRAASMLFSAALVALDRTHGPASVDIMRIWTESLSAAGEGVN